MIEMRVHVQAGNGENVYMMTGTGATALLEFIKQYDHDGAAVSLSVMDTQTRKVHGYEGEAAYAYLRSLV